MRNTVGWLWCSGYYSGCLCEDNCSKEISEELIQGKFNNFNQIIKIEYTVYSSIDYGKKCAVRIYIFIT